MCIFYLVANTRWKKSSCVVNGNVFSLLGISAKSVACFHLCEILATKMLHEIFYFLIGLGVIFYIYMIWHFDYWKKRHVPAPQPRFLLGNLPGAVTQRRHLSYDVDDIYR